MAWAGGQGWAGVKDACRGGVAGSGEGAWLTKLHGEGGAGDGHMSLICWDTISEGWLGWDESWTSGGEPEHGGEVFGIAAFCVAGEAPRAGVTGCAAGDTSPSWRPMHAT